MSGADRPVGSSVPGNTPEPHEPELPDVEADDSAFDDGLFVGHWSAR